MKRSSRFVEDIQKAVQTGRLKEPFRAADIKVTCSGWSNRTYSNFLPKHRKGNPGNYTEYFLQHPDGSYSLIEH